jgi:hypothetical protein
MAGTTLITNRRLLWCGLAGALLLTGLFCGPLLFSKSPRNMRPRLERVTEGMTLNQVVETVGCLPGDYTGDHNAHFNSAKGNTRLEFWDFDDGNLNVYIDHNGKAYGVFIGEHYHPTTMDRLRRLLDL